MSSEFDYNLSGDKIAFNSTKRGRIGFRAIVNIGLLNAEDKHLTPVNDALEIISVS